MKLQKLLAILNFMLISAFCFSLIAQTDGYEDRALYVKFKNASKMSAKSFGTEEVSVKNLSIKSSVVEKYSIKPQAMSLSFFDNPILDKTFKIEVGKDVNLDNLIEALEKNTDVEYAEKVPYYTIFAVKPTNTYTPNDPFYGTVDGTVPASWNLDVVRAEEAWQLQQGKPSIKVAIVDNAIWGEHEDLLIPGTLQYNTVTRTEGYSGPPNWVNQDEICPSLNNCNAYDYSHGTHCAGVVGAISNNGKGIASLASGITLMGIGGPSNDNPNAVVNSTEGIRWAVENGANVISCSFGGGGYSSTQNTFFTTCAEQNIVIVAAAGNDLSNEIHYPAGYDNCISVASVDSDMKRSSFSNYGNWIDIAAPGGMYKRISEYPRLSFKIFSTTFSLNTSTRLSGCDLFENTYYDDMSGTSMACPMVASLIGLMFSADSSLTFDEIRTILQNTSQEREINSPMLSNFAGTIDAYEAIMAVRGRNFGNPVSKISGDSDFDTIWVNWEAPSDTTNLIGYNFYENGKIIDSLTTAMSFADTGIFKGEVILYSVEAVYKNNIKSVRKDLRLKKNAILEVTLTSSPREAADTLIGAGLYEKGTSIIVRAFAKEGYVFKEWTNFTDIKFSRPELYLAVKKNERLFARFDKIVNNEELLLNSKIIISPNPATDKISIESPYKINEITISNMSGTILKRVNVNGNNVDITIDNLNSGLYVITVNTEKGVVKSKISKI